MKSTTHHILNHAVILILGLGLAIIPFIQSNWLPTSPDSAGLSCGAQYIADTGEFETSRVRDFNFHYNPCWTADTYPGNQVFTAGVISLTGLPSYVVVVLLSMFTYILCALVLYWIAFTITQHSTTALWSALSALGSLALARSLLLTPHNLYGYAFILLGILGIALWERKKSWLYGLLLVISVIALAAFHTLSLAIFGIALCIFIFITFYRSPKQLGIYILALILLGIVVGKVALGTWDPFLIVSGIRNISIAGITNPWYDHPAVWGYTATGLAIVGLSCIWREKKVSRAMTLSICVGMVSILFAHPSLTGVEVLPERVIAYAWIPIALLAGKGIQQIMAWTKGWYRYLLVLVLFISIVVHFIVFLQDSYVGISKRFLPDADFIAAMQWLETHKTPETFVLTVGDVVNRQITYSGLWYSGDSAWYPMYRLNHKDITEFKSTDTTYAPIVQEKSHPDHQRLKDLYTFVTLQEKSAAQNIADTYTITHFLAWKKGKEYPIWENNTLFPIVYENNQYVIYETY